MEWETILSNILTILLSTTLGSFLSYKLSVKKCDTKINEVTIKCETEIQKIKEESKREIEKIRVEQEELRKTSKSNSAINMRENEENLKNHFTSKMFETFIDDPEKGMEKINKLIDLQNKLPKKKGRHK